MCYDLEQHPKINTWPSFHKRPNVHHANLLNFHYYILWFYVKFPFFSHQLNM